MRFSILCCSVLLSLIGCQRDDSIVAYKAPKEPARAAAAPADQNAHHDHNNELTWTLPEGWTQLPAAQMRYAAFQASADDPNLVVTVIPLAPGQAILPNINRWEGQIGLPPSSEADAKSKLKMIEVAGEMFASLDLNGPSQSIVVAFTQQPEHTWFFKLQGPSDKVAAQKPKFEAFVQSLRFAGHEPTTAPAPAEPDRPAFADGAPKWNLPSAWRLQPEKPMRFATYRTSADATSGEVIISRFPAQFGSILDNVNRWRGMVGLPPITGETGAPPQHLTVGAAQSDVYDFTGPEKPPAPAQRIRIILVPTPDGKEMWFFRLQGPVDVLSKEQPAFDQFVQSVRF
ncbi:MAG: hypothetical protein H7Z14_08945 [Anaerolineae bacterium]|nr:hypothetical protein [Phycisphaerae bacterium]